MKTSEPNTNFDLTPEKLKILFERFSLPNRGVAETCRILAGYLNQQSQPQTKWNWQYIHQVIHHKLPPSKMFILAVNRLFEKQAEKNTVELEAITIIAPIGYVAPNTLIMIAAKECANNLCHTMFIPKNGNHRFCSKLCRKFAQNHNHQTGSITRGK